MQDASKIGEKLYFQMKTFNLGSSDDLQYYGHDQQKERKVLSRKQNGSGSLIVWIISSKFGQNNLDFSKVRIDSKKYTDILAFHLIPFQN